MSAFYKIKCKLSFKIFYLSLLCLISIATHGQEKNNFPETLPAPPEDTLGNNKIPDYVVIRPSDQATFSSETAAQVARVNVKEGSTFKVKEILLELDCRLQKAELNKALAQQKSAAMAKNAAQKLKNYGSISEYEFIKATADEQIANAEVDKLEAIVDKCIITAPFNGAVAELMVRAHESVKPGDPLIKVVNIENLEFEMQVPSCWLGWIHIGTDFTVLINETNKKISAKITKINPQIEPVSQSVKIIATILPPDPTLLPGMSGQAHFEDSPTNKCPQSKN